MLLHSSEHVDAKERELEKQECQKKAQHMNVFGYGQALSERLDAKHCIICKQKAGTSKTCWPAIQPFLYMARLYLAPCGQSLQQRRVVDRIASAGTPSRIDMLDEQIEAIQREPLYA